MSESKIVGKTPSRLKELKEKSGQIPFIRTNRFVYGSLGVLVLIGIFLFSGFSLPNNLQTGMIYFFLLLMIGWVAVIFTDELKPEWAKTFSAFVMLFVAGMLYYRFSTAQWARMGELFFNLKVMEQVWPRLIDGLVATIKLAVFAAILSTVLGLLLAVFRSFNNRVLNIFIVGYIDFFRAMPIIVLLVLIYYALPYMGITLSAMVSGVIGLGLNSSAYVSEIFRSGIESVKKGQIEAARALGLSPMQTMKLVILPQAFRVVIPPLVGNYVASAKDTAICSSISIIELLKTALAEQALLANPSPLIFVTLVYIVMFVPLTRLSTLLEARMKLSVRKINV